MNPEDDNDLVQVIKVLEKLQDEIIAHLDELAIDSDFTNANPEYADEKLNMMMHRLKSTAKELLEKKEKLDDSSQYNRIINILK